MRFWWYLKFSDLLCGKLLACFVYKVCKEQMGKNWGNLFEEILCYFLCFFFIFEMRIMQQLKHEKVETIKTVITI